MTASNPLAAQARWRPWEPVLWLAALVTPWLFKEHALIINEVAIVALFAVSLDLILGYTGIVSLGHAAFFGLGGSGWVSSWSKFSLKISASSSSSSSVNTVPAPFSRAYIANTAFTGI